MKSICITGAAGNLGSLTAKYLMDTSDWKLNLMIHNAPFPYVISDRERIQIFKTDLNIEDTLKKSLNGVDVIIHYAGVLFHANPEKFLSTTNVKYFENLVTAALEAHVKKIILISFPHVEGMTTPNKPSTDRLDGDPISMHARTRLEEEKILYKYYPEGIILRVGMVYGKGILMPDAAKWFAKRWLLGVWKTPTWIHLISKDDFLEAVKNAAEKDGIRGTYNIGDNGYQTLQDYLDFSCKQWNCKKPWRMPEWMIYTAAAVFETISAMFGIKSPLTKDFIDIGKVSYYGDTTRMKNELLSTLKYPTMQDGVEIF